MIRVIKVGGSLFELPDLSERIGDFLSQLPVAINVLIAGGGKLTDVIEHWQSLHGFTDEQVHWLCIRALSVSAAWLQTLLPESMLGTHPHEIRKSSAKSLWIFDAESLLRSNQVSQAVRSLPRNASVTTDSIAAAVSLELNASELILLKSTNWLNQHISQRSDAIQTGAKVGLVDQHFPIITIAIARLGWVNLRQSPACTWIV